MGLLEGKVAIVTGAGSGIGQASALLFASEGATVLALDRASNVESTVSMIREASGRGVSLMRDASNEEEIEATVRLAESEFGGLDVCYANAGISGGQVSLFEQSAGQFTEILKTNLIGSFLLIKHGAQAMVKRQRGSIICTASIAGLRSGAGGIPYSASKAGVISLVQTVANQLTGTGVRINAICPGLIETGMTRPVFERARVRGTTHRIGQLNPMQRPGVPSEIAQVALFLASESSSYVTGQAIAVDGGLSSTHPTVNLRRSM